MLTFDDARRLALEALIDDDDTEDDGVVWAAAAEGASGPTAYQVTLNDLRWLRDGDARWQLLGGPTVVDKTTGAVVDMTWDEFADLERDMRPVTAAAPLTR